MKIKCLLMLTLSWVALCAAETVIDVTTLGVKNDGSVVVSAIVNAATERVPGLQ